MAVSLIMDAQSLALRDTSPRDFTARVLNAEIKISIATTDFYQLDCREATVCMRSGQKWMGLGQKCHENAPQIQDTRCLIICISI